MAGTKKKNNSPGWPLCVLLALVSAAALCYNGVTPDVGAAADGTAGALVNALTYAALAVGSPGAAGTLLFLVLIPLYRFVLTGRRREPAAAALALLFSINLLTGKSMNLYGDLTLFFGRAAQSLVAAIVLFGWAAALYALLLWLLGLADKRREAPHTPGEGLAERLTGGRGFLLPAGVIFLCWLPRLAIFCPGSLSWDAFNQLNMFSGVETWYNAHPVFSTVLIGGCVSLGRALGSDNLGLFFYTLLQSAALALALGYSLSCMSRWRAGLTARLVVLGVFALCPLWSGFAQWVVKDTAYIAAALVFTCRVMELARQPQRRDSLKGLVVLGLLGLLAALLRKNGILLALCSLAALIPAAGGWRPRLYRCAVFGAVALVFCCYNYLLVPAVGIGGESSSELMSVPLQQTARCVAEHGDELEPWQVEGISGILVDGGYETLTEAYDPRISDPVKNLCYWGRTEEDEAAFFRVWSSLMARYPITCLEAVIANTCAYYCPNVGGSQTLPYGSFIETNPLVNTGYFDFHYLSGDGIRSLVGYADRGVSKLPGLWLLYSQGACTWLLLALALYALRLRRPGLLAGLAPALATLVMCLLSSVNGEYRYFAPVVASLPALAAGVLSAPGRQK